MSKVPALNNLSIHRNRAQSEQRHWNYITYALSCGYKGPHKSWWKSSSHFQIHLVSMGFLRRKHAFRVSALSLSVPLNGCDTVMGLQELQRQKDGENLSRALQAGLNGKLSDQRELLCPQKGTPGEQRSPVLSQGIQLIAPNIHSPQTPAISLQQHAADLWLGNTIVHC